MTYTIIYYIYVSDNIYIHIYIYGEHKNNIYIYIIINLIYIYISIIQYIYIYYIGTGVDALTCRAPAPHFGDCHEKERIELACGLAGIAPGDAQDAVSGPDKSSSFSSYKTGESEEGSPGCKDIENEPAQCLEELFGGQRGEVEGILPRLREARYRAGPTGPNSHGGCQDSPKKGWRHPSGKPKMWRT